MVSNSIVEVTCQYRLLSVALKIFGRKMRREMCSCLQVVGIGAPWTDKYLNHDDENPGEISDSSPIKPWMWLSGLLISIVVTCLSAGLQWDMPVYMTIASILLAMIFTVLAILSTGMTDMTPLTAISKSSQLVLGTMTRGDSYTLAKAETLNSLGGAIAAGVANQATDLTADFRVG